MLRRGAVRELSSVCFCARVKRQQGNKHTDTHCKLLTLFNFLEDFWFFRLCCCSFYKHWGIRLWFIFHAYRARGVRNIVARVIGSWLFHRVAALGSVTFRYPARKRVCLLSFRTINFLFICLFLIDTSGHAIRVFICCRKHMIDFNYEYRCALMNGGERMRWRDSFTRDKWSDHS